ncbi:hypothetical protein GCM10009758_15780 [Microbacterium hatanonis]
MLGHVSAATPARNYASLLGDDLDAVATPVNAKMPSAALRSGPRTRYAWPQYTSRADLSVFDEARAPK